MRIRTTCNSVEIEAKSDNFHMSYIRAKNTHGHPFFHSLVVFEPKFAIYIDWHGLVSMKESE